MKLFLGLFLLGSFCFAIVLFYFAGDSRFQMPVVGAGKKDYDQQSFGAPRVGHRHKGVDIFARKGTPVISATTGLVLYTGVLSLGGNVVLIAGPGLRMYYYAHLDQIATHPMSIVGIGETIGTVGNTGNARYTPSHLHFSMRNIFPWRGGKYIDPVPVINKALGADHRELL